VIEDSATKEEDKGQRKNRAGPLGGRSSGARGTNSPSLLRADAERRWNPVVTKMKARLRRDRPEDPYPLDFYLDTRLCFKDGRAPDSGADVTYSRIGSEIAAVRRGALVLLSEEAIRKGGRPETTIPPASAPQVSPSLRKTRFERHQELVSH